MKIIYNVLATLGAVHPYQVKGKEEYYFNKYSPVGWVLLIIIALIQGVASFGIGFYATFKTVLQDAKKARKQAK